MELKTAVSFGRRIVRAGAAMAVLAVAAVTLPPAHALQGQYDVHDPSTVVQDNGRYWMFGTGEGIVSRYSDDLVTWHHGPTVFPVGSWPSWINSRVPGFAGNFWAPELHKMNGKYYLFYSASSWGSNVSAIGVAVTPSLNTPSWTDLGVVVASTSGSTYNAIDPAVFRDAGGTPWMTYGSYFGGIALLQLNAATAKPANATQTTIAGNGTSWAEMEAPSIVYRDGYYYLFLNKGTCCNGTSSTYHIQVGRSTSITGPYRDKNGVAMTANGGSTLVASAGRFIGPGHFSRFLVGSTEYMGFHYYDGSQNGAPKFDLARLTWSGGWPVYSPNWLANGSYRVTSVFNGLSWDNWGCTGANGQPLAQASYAGLGCQQWTFTHQGSGVYRIASAISGRVVESAGCSAAAGSLLQVYDDWGGDCQRFRVERTADNRFVFSSMAGNRVIDVTGWSTSAGTQLQLWDGLGGDNQRWIVAAP